MQGVYSMDCLHKRMIMRCHKDFNEACESAILTSVIETNVNTVATVITTNLRMSLQQLEAGMHIPRTLLPKILKDKLKMKRVLCTLGALHVNARTRVMSRHVPGVSQYAGRRFEFGDILCCNRRRIVG